MANPPLLNLQNIHLSFGVTPLLVGAEMSVSAGERLCLVGRNGSGKSTLMKVAAGLVEPDDGTIFVQPGATVRYLHQDPDLSAFDTVMDYVRSGLTEGDDEYKAQYLLEQLGLNGEEPASTLSGGEARRAALAQVLAPDPDVLMLDEPTNHLDLPAIEWLEEELKSVRSAIVLISHDRRFLTNLTRKTLWLDRGQTRLSPRGFGQFEEWRDKLLEEEELEQHKLDRKIVREEHWLRYGVTARRKRNVRRLGDLHALRQKRDDYLGPQGQVKLQVTSAKESGKLVVEAKGLSKTWGEKCVIKDFSIKIPRNARIGLIGANGTGKTTLINLLTGELESDTGSLKLGANLEIATLDQKRAELKADWTLSEALTLGGGHLVEINGSTKHVIAYMKDFLFPPEQANTPVEVLSGGEKARLMLARSLALPSNLLVLDEPTNDLDLETLDLLQALISDYKGTVFVVSHDRDFLDRVCTSVLVSDGDGDWQEYPGGYSDMARQRSAHMKARDKGERAAKTASASKPAAAPPPAKKRMANKDRYALKLLPDEIEKLSLAIEKLEAQMADPKLFSDTVRFKQVSDDLAKALEARAEKEDRWLELEALREEIEG